ncbi:hypothetical protein [Isobaculum melis]|nr:hypothetical protein [Isobaculum melis]
MNFFNLSNATESQKENFYSQFDNIWQKKHFVKTINYKVNPNFDISIDYYHYTEQKTANFWRSIDCQQITLFKNKKKIYLYKNYDGFIKFSLITTPQANLIFGTSDLSAYFLFDLNSEKGYEYLAKSVIDGEGIPIDYWKIDEIVYNESNKLLFINGKDTMNCATTSIVNLSMLYQLPYPVYDIPTYVHQQYNEYACTAIRWENNTTLQLEIGEENQLTTALSISEIINHCDRYS